MNRLLLVFIVFLCSSCMAGPYVELNGEKFTVELAETREKQALGLMFRDSLEENHGMLFIFPDEAPLSFWMKNSRIPLDIMYFDKDLKLVSISANTPPCRVSRCPSYPSTAPAQYVLELNAGTAAKLGVGIGDRLTLNLN